MPSPHNVRLFFDENMPLSSVVAVQELGVDAIHARNVLPRGASDKQIADYAKNNKCILITRDLEFASIIIYPEGSHYGLVVLRLSNTFIAAQINAALKEFLAEVKAEELVGKIAVLETGRFRIREAK